MFASTGDDMFAVKSAELGQKILPAYATESGLPYDWYNSKLGVSL